MEDILSLSSSGRLSRSPSMLLSMLKSLSLFLRYTEKGWFDQYCNYELCLQLSRKYIFITTKPQTSWLPTSRRRLQDHSFSTRIVQMQPFGPTFVAWPGLFVEMLGPRTQSNKKTAQTWQKTKLPTPVNFCPLPSAHAEMSATFQAFGKLPTETKKPSKKTTK